LAIHVTTVAADIGCYSGDMDLQYNPFSVLYQWSTGPFHPSSPLSIINLLWMYI
jgi:hypothetical protein